MTEGIPYPQRNSIITFREPFYRQEVFEDKIKYYIRACINSDPEQEIRVAARQQREVMDLLIKQDLKLTNAVVRNSDNGLFSILDHSPQIDFFSLVKEEKCTQFVSKDT